MAFLRESFEELRRREEAAKASIEENKDVFDPACLSRLER